MLREALRRGTLAGVAGGGVYGLYLAVVGDPMVALAERFETGQAAPATGPLEAVATLTAGVLWGLLLGVVAFGLAYYILEPALPGESRARSFFIGVAGFVTVSGGPWLAVPPQPPGMEYALSTGVRLGWYGLLAGASALAFGLALSALRRSHRVHPALRALALTAPLVLPLGLASLSPVGAASGPAPPELVGAFQGMTAVGQALLWFVMATTHAWLGERP